MAKQPTSKGGTSRIRFIMLEAEISEGDLSQVTAAIQNALKPATTNIVQQRTTPSSTSAALSSTLADLEIDGEAIVLDDEEEQSEPKATKQARESKPRKPTSMNVLDLDLTSATSFESFASTHSPKNDTERNLVALAWFKEHRPDEVVTADHIYTCYRAIKWPSGIADFPKILRNLKGQQLVKNTGRGQYEINHLGIARVEKMGPAA